MIYKSKMGSEQPEIIGLVMKQPSPAPEALADIQVIVYYLLRKHGLTVGNCYWIASIVYNLGVIHGKRERRKEYRD